jgi:hypothetical protein
MTWMAMWPISLGWTGINFFGVRFFRHVYYQIAGVLQRISDNVFKGEENDFRKKEAVNVRP